MASIDSHGLILDANGRPILHPHDIIAIKNRRTQKVTEPLIFIAVNLSAGVLLYKEPMSSKVQQICTNDLDIKLLARGNDGQE